MEYNVWHNLMNFVPFHSYIGRKTTRTADFFQYELHQQKQVVNLLTIFKKNKKNLCDT